MSRLTHDCSIESPSSTSYVPERLFFEAADGSAQLRARLPATK